MLLGTILLVSLSKGYSQTINWTSLEKEQKHIINASFGYEYSMNYGFGYGYQLNTKMPIILNVEYSAPAGEKLIDDFKTKIGGQIKFYEINNFAFSGQVQGIFRRYDNPAVRLLNFGAEISLTAGYYKPKWFVAAEAGFDKAIATNFKHSSWTNENTPGVQDGWYEPATGGNFSYGIKGSYSFNQHEIFGKVGMTVTEDFKSTPMIPLYARIGYQIKF